MAECSRAGALRPVTEDMAPNSNTIGGFEIIRRLPDQGWQGIVYEARCVESVMPNVAVGGRVALKVMSVPDPEGDFARRLKRRTDALAAMRHANLLQYFGCFSDKGGVLADQDFHVVVMEYLEGIPLKKALDQAPSGLDADRALAIIRACMAALIYASEHRIVHRDIKPSNVFLCADGTVKLIDFEIARQQGGTVTGSSQGNLRGTFDYMAPDFLDPEFHGDERSDVFSLAVCLHEALTGRTPYEKRKDEGQQGEFIFYNRWYGKTDGVIRISSRIQALVPRLKPILEVGLSADRAKRYASFTAFEEALRPVKPYELNHEAVCYQLLQLVGQGGFGKVYKARNLTEERLVAVKCLLRPEYADRFTREARLLKQLSGVPVVRFVDFFSVSLVAGEQYFLVMDYLPGMPGSSLRDRLKKNEPIPFEETIRAFIRYAEGLSALHGLKVYHRDIKPSNLYLPRGAPEQACLMDLGVARDAKGTATHGQVPGSLDYMPPEVVFGSSRGDAGMDLFALGLCLFEALTGTPAYPRLPPGDQALIGLSKRARDKVRPNLEHPLVTGRPALHELIRAMTEPELESRIQSAGLVVAALRRQLPGMAASASVADEAPPHTSATAVTPAAQPEVATRPAGALTQMTVYPETVVREKLERVRAERAERRKSRRGSPFRLAVPDVWMRRARRVGIAILLFAALGAASWGIWLIREPLLLHSRNAAGRAAEHCRRAVLRTRIRVMTALRGDRVEAVIQETRDRLSLLAVSSDPEAYGACTGSIREAVSDGRARLAAVVRGVPAELARQWEQAFDTDLGNELTNKLRNVSDSAQRMAEAAADEAVRLYGEQNGAGATRAQERYAQWCRLAGVEAVRENEIRDAYAAYAKQREIAKKQGEVAAAQRLQIETAQKRLAETAEAVKDFTGADLERLEELRTGINSLQTCLDAANRVTGVDTEAAARILSQLKRREAWLTGAVEIALQAPPPPALEPPAAAEVSLDEGKTWQVLRPGQPLKAEPGRDVLVRYQRPDYKTLGPETGTIKAGEPYAVAWPERGKWVPGDTKRALDELRGLVEKAAWEDAARMTNRVVEAKWTWPAHRAQARELAGTVRKHFEEREQVRERERLARNAELAAEQARQEVAQRREAERLTEVRKLTDRLRHYSQALTEGRAPEFDADFAWPHPRADVADDPEAVRAANQVIRGLASWFDRACADDPVETRAARLSNAVRLARAAVMPGLLGKDTAQNLLTKIAAARAHFLLRVRNESGHKASLSMSGRNLTLEEGHEEAYRLDGAVFEVTARAEGYQEQKLRLAWAEGGGQVLRIAPFTPKPIEITLEGGQAVRVSVTDRSGHPVADQAGTHALAPGEYAVAFARADYETQRLKLILRVGDAGKRLSPGPWRQSVALRKLEEAEAAFGEGAAALSRAAALLTEVAPLADPDHQTRKSRLEERVVAGFTPLAERELTALRVWHAEMERLDFQVADPETGALRKEKPGEAPSPQPVVSVIPEWVTGRFPAALRQRWQNQARDEAGEKMLSLCRDAHEIRYRDGFGMPGYFPHGVCLNLAEAVDLGYVPDAYDLALAEFALQACEKEVEKKKGLGGKNVIIDTNKIETARQAVAKIRQAAEKRAR